MKNSKTGEVKRSSYKGKRHKKIVRNILPPISDKMSLSKFGYSLKKPMKMRRMSLKKASNKTSTLEVERRVNLIRNYSKWNQSNYAKLSADVEFMKREYAKEKSKKVSKK